MGIWCYIRQHVWQYEFLIISSFFQVLIIHIYILYIISLSLSCLDLVSEDYDAQLKLLQELWFTPYSRGKGIVGSSSFEHVFMAELRGETVLGMHNWLYFAEQEQQGHVDYKGWISRAETGRVLYINNRYFQFLIYFPFAAQWIRHDVAYELLWRDETL